MQSSRSIDLIKGKTNLTDEIIKWALSFGRFLIIVVEIVAFSAFIYRFSLDRHLSDINDKIKQEQEILTATKPQENTYRSLQEKLATVKKASTTGNAYYKILNDIIALTPPEITYNSFSILDGKINMEINMTSVQSLTAFMKSLQNYPNITSIAITGIDNSSGDNTVTVTLIGNLKQNTKSQ